MKMTTRRNSFIGGGTGTVVAFGLMKFAAQAAEFSYKMGTTTPLTHPVSVRATAAAEKIKQESGGRLEIGVFPNNALGGDSAMILQVRTGALEFLVSDNNNLMTVIPVIGVTLIPFAFKNERDAGSAFDGPLGLYLRNAIVKTDPNLHPFAKTWGSGFRQVSNNVRPIQAQADLRGLKMRVPSSAIFVDTFKALGAVPTPIDGRDIYMAMQTHLVDGADVTLSAVDSGKYYEVLKYLSITNHLYQGFTLLGSTAAWSKLPKNIQEITERNFDAAAVLDRSDVARLDETLRGNLEGRGLVFNQVDVVSFRTSLNAAGLYAKWRAQFGSEAWAALEKTVGKLT
jgi:TRAP-type transport system periplasmic protein